MGSNIEFQRYDPELSEEIMAVSKRSMFDAYDGGSEYEPSNDMAALEEMFQDDSSKVYIGMVDDQPVVVGGYLHNDEDEAEIQTIRVDPEHQRNGYAQRILDKIFEEIQKRGYQRIVLHTSEYSTAAQSLYEKNGFEETHRSMHKGEEWVYYKKEI